jgi:hypothetical protein
VIQLAADDVVAMTDILGKTAGMVLSQALGSITDTLRKKASQYQSDSLTESDLLQEKKAAMRLLTDSLSISDLLQKLKTQFRQVSSDTLTVSDMLAFLRTRVRDLSADVLSITDVVSNSRSSHFLDSLAYADVLVKHKIFPISITDADGGQITDILSKIHRYVRAIKDSICSGIGTGGRPPVRDLGGTRRLSLHRNTVN